MMADAPARIIVADDHPLLLKGLEDVLRTQRDLAVVGAYADGGAALAAIHEHRPAIAVLDLNMPRMSGLEIVAALRSAGSRTRIVLLSGSMLDEQIHAAVSMDVEGLILKDSAPDQLLQCLREIMAGRRWYPAELVAEAVRREEKQRSAASAIVRQLTLRERQLLGLLAEGVSNKEIARQLSISDNTVKIHFHRIYQKLGVSDRSALLKMTLALRRHLSG